MEKSENLCAEIEPEVKLPQHPLDVGNITEEQLNAELEKGYADMKTGHVVSAKKVFASIMSISKNGYGKPVVMDIDHYEQTMHKTYEAKQINEGLSDLANGKTVDGDTVKRKMATKYGI